MAGSSVPAASHPGAKLGAVDFDAELGARVTGIELPAITPAPTFMPEPSCSSFSFLSGFFSPHFALPH